jgi:hypothetical protein
MILFLLALGLSSLVAEDWSHLLGAKDLDELTRLEKRITSSKKYEEGCQDELLAPAQFPYSCLHWLEREMSQIHSGPNSLQPLLMSVNRACELHASDIESLPKIIEILHRDLPSQCRRALEERRQDLLYINSKTNGTNIDSQWIHYGMDSKKSDI